jgi:NADPH-dependent FMN reductase
MARDVLTETIRSTPLTSARDAVLLFPTLTSAQIATPEYYHGVPGVLKNAFDWLSRPPRDSALNGKVAALMGASPGITESRSSGLVVLTEAPPSCSRRVQPDT